MYEIKKELSNSDINHKGFMSLKSIVDMLQDAEGLDIYYSKILNNHLKENDAGIFITFRQINIYKNASFADQIKALSYPTKTNKRFGYRNTIIYDKDDNVLVSSNSIGPFVKLKEEKLISIPDEIIESLNHIEQFDMEYLDRKIILKDEGIKLEKILVTHNLIDRYFHLNNSYYIEIAHSLIRSDFFFNQIRVEYKKAAKKNDYLYPRMHFLNKKIIIDLKDENNESYALIEFGGM